MFRAIGPLANRMARPWWRLVDGFPAGLKLTPRPIDVELRRRQGGYGRGGRQRIETDHVDIKTGIWQGLLSAVRSRWKSSTATTSSNASAIFERPRPGHGDLTGAIKYLGSIRGTLERASARETTVRVAAGALAEQLLAEFGIRAFGYVVEIGGMTIAAATGHARRAACSAVTAASSTR